MRIVEGMSVVAVFKVRTTSCVHTLVCMCMYAKEEHCTTLVYQLLGEGLKLSSVYDTMEEARESLDITVNWRYIISDSSRLLVMLTN